MSDQDIEKLLAQVSQSTQGTTQGSGSTPGTPAKSERAAATSQRSKQGSPGGRLAFAVIAGIVLGVLTWVLGVFLPFTAAIPMGLGGLIGAFVVALIAGPPRWFSS